MAIVATKTNTKIYKLGDSGYVRVTYDTGAKDAEGQPVTLQATMSQASIEKSAGVLLPKAQIKAIVEAALNGQAAHSDTELTTALA